MKKKGDKHTRAFVYWIAFVFKISEANNPGGREPCYNWLTQSRIGGDTRPLFGMANRPKTMPNSKRLFIVDTSSIFQILDVLLKSGYLMTFVWANHHNDQQIRSLDVRYIKFTLKIYLLWNNTVRKIKIWKYCTSFLVE